MRGSLVFVAVLSGCLQQAELPSCGDGVCSAGEGPFSCPEDCITTTGTPVCGNGVCETGELASCPTDCREQPTCDATTLGSAPVDLTSTTADAPGQLDVASCGDGVSAPARTYLWRAPATGRYDVTVTAGFAVVLDVSRGGCFGPEVGCSAAQGTVSVALQTGESIAIAVTGLAGASGAFHLQVTREAEACGNGACELGEDCSSCASDCGACPVCGDGSCNGSETCGSCPGDCGACPTCGDGVCSPGEDCSSCPGDCGACPSCGDGVCNAGEDCNTCSSDCGTCPSSYCGDGSCDANETCSSCSSDCGSCAPYCGDGTCNAGEDCDSCPGDCGTCGSYCGDGSCDAGEDCDSCSSDCGTCDDE